MAEKSARAAERRARHQVAPGTYELGGMLVCERQLLERDLRRLDLCLRRGEALLDAEERVQLRIARAAARRTLRLIEECWRAASPFGLN